MPFDAGLFNFTKVKEYEILFCLKRSSEENDTDRESSDYIVINVSPLEYCNSLLVPRLKDCLPQVLTPESILLAIDTVLLSNDFSFRAGFNSLGGFASVNHHHYHIYYLCHRLYLETAKVDHIWGEVYEITDYPAEGFAFQVSKENKGVVVKHIMTLVQMLLESSVAHNLFITRGTSFHEAADTGQLSVVRVYLWARESCYGAKDESAFNVALCELGGHLPMKSEESFSSATEEYACQVLRSFTHEAFVQVRRRVVHLQTQGGDLSI